MSAAAASILRDIYGANAGKKIARRFSVSTDTAKLWLAGRFPQTRTLQLKAAVDAELSRIEARNTEIRRQLGLEGRRGFRKEGGEAGGGEVVGDVREDSSEAVGFRGEMK